MWLIILEPKKKRPGVEERYLAERIFFNYTEAERYAQEQMQELDVEASIAEVSHPALTKIEVNK